MKKYNINKKVIGICFGSALAVACVLAYLWFTVHTDKNKVEAARVHVESYISYDMVQNGKVVLTFEQDTLSGVGYFVNKWDFTPTCQGRVWVNIDNSVWQNKYKGANPQHLLEEMTNIQDSIYKDAKWKLAELRYYVKSHNVTDEGYNMISRYEAQEKVVCDSAKKMLDSLNHIKKGQNLKIVFRRNFMASYPWQKDNPQKEQDKETILKKGKAGYICEKLDPIDGNLYQLHSKQTPDGAKALLKSQANSLAGANIYPLSNIRELYFVVDSTNRYTGEVDSIGLPHGHGQYISPKGAYYEGSWLHGKRNGFGFSIEYHKQLRAGEWKNNVYKGERLVYRSDRIYGIDISKHQHVKGKKKYGINWSKLRIVHLGNISKKTISGSVNYPISFIYIKSTEGSSILNPYYKKDYAAAKAHGYKVGTYHFFSTLTPANKQASQFLKYSFVRSNDLPPVLDVEPTHEQIKKMGGTGVLFARMRTWLRLVERATGKKPILYISQTFVNRYLSQAPDLKKNYQVWIARYGEYKPDVKMAYWQLCPDGKVAGIQGYVDINVFNGYHDAYSQFVSSH